MSENQTKYNHGGLSSQTTIRTFSGIMMDVFNPTPEMICIEDIAHSLSNQCRSGGHIEPFYSVAQHSLVVAEFTNYLPELKLASLLHDASEAYLLDIPTPIKKRLPDYQAVEAGLMKVIAEKYGFEFPLHEMVKVADRDALAFEYEAIVKKQKYDWFIVMPGAEAKQRFLAMFYELTAGKE